MNRKITADYMRNNTNQKGLSNTNKSCSETVNTSSSLTKIFQIRISFNTESSLLGNDGTKRFINTNPYLIKYKTVMSFY